MLAALFRSSRSSPANRGRSSSSTRCNPEGARSRRSSVRGSTRCPLIVVDPQLTSATNGLPRSQQNQQQQQQAIPIIPPGAEATTTQMLFERNALANRITAIQLAIADASVNSNAP